MSEPNVEPNAQLDPLIAPWIDLFDLDLTDAGVPLSERPFRALLRLLAEKVVRPRVGDHAIAPDEIVDHVEEVWFRALYLRVERWYERAYGAEAIRGKGGPPLEGAILIRGAAYALRAPSIRRVVHVEGRETWMYFEASVGQGENAVDWLADAPDLAGFDPQRRADVETAAHEVAARLRLIHFHRMGVNGDRAAEGLADAAHEYLQSAARRICAARAKDLGPAWFDLQMAAESALKLVLQLRTGTYRRTHEMDWLLARATSHGVSFDARRVADWPAFGAISELRYAQADPGGLHAVYQAYRTILDLVAAAMASIETPLAPGAGILLRRPPWLMDPAEGRGQVRARNGASRRRRPRS